MKRLRIAVVACCWGAWSSTAAASGWSLDMARTHVMVASLRASDATGALQVNCADGSVEVDLGRPVDSGGDVLERLTISFGTEPITRELEAHWIGDTRQVLTIESPSFAGQLAGHDGGRLEVHGRIGADSMVFAFDLSGTIDAFAVCGLAVTPESHPDAWQPEMVDGVRYFDRDTYKVIKRVMPTYPPAAERLDEELICIVSVYINTDGVPFDARAVRCPDAVRDAAIEALMQWRWRPVLVEGVAVVAQTGVVLKFVPGPPMMRLGRKK